MKKILTKKIAILSILMIGLLSPVLVLAIDTSETSYVLLEPAVINKSAGDTAPELTAYLSILFTSILSLVVALSILMITIGGFEMLISNIPLVKADGKTKITNALGGLLLALASWLILNTINPKLVSFDFLISQADTNLTAISRIV